MTGVHLFSVARKPCGAITPNSFQQFTFISPSVFAGRFSARKTASEKLMRPAAMPRCAVLLANTGGFRGGFNEN